MADRSQTGGLLALSTFALLAVGLNFATSRWPKLGRTIEGHPIVLVRDGIVDDRAVRSQRITISELESATRQLSIETVAAVHLAFLESNGKNSFFRRAESS